MSKELNYGELIKTIEAKRKKLGVKIDPRNFIPIIREEVRYKNGKK